MRTLFCYSSQEKLFDRKMIPFCFLSKQHHYSHTLAPKDLQQGRNPAGRSCFPDLRLADQSRSGSGGMRPRGLGQAPLMLDRINVHMSWSPVV